MTDDDLPPELKAQLSSRTGAASFTRIVFQLFQGETDLNALLIRVYRKTGQVSTRKEVQAAVTRLIAHGKVVPIDGHKGLWKVKT